MLVALSHAFDVESVDRLLFLSLCPKDYLVVSGDGLLSFSRLIAAGLASVLIFDIRFHPNQGVYFNFLVGGPRGAFTRYDMDYWGNCVLQAVEWAVDTARASGTVVTISGQPL